MSVALPVNLALWQPDVHACDTTADCDSIVATIPRAPDAGSAQCVTTHDDDAGELRRCAFGCGWGFWPMPAVDFPYTCIDRHFTLGGPCVEEALADGAQKLFPLYNSAGCDPDSVVCSGDAWAATKTTSCTCTTGPRKGQANDPDKGCIFAQTMGQGETAVCAQPTPLQYDVVSSIVCPPVQDGLVGCDDDAQCSLTCNDGFMADGTTACVPLTAAGDKRQVNTPPTIAQAKVARDSLPSETETSTSGSPRSRRGALFAGTLLLSSLLLHI